MPFDSKAYDKWRWANDPKRRAALAARRGKPENRVEAAARAKAWREANPERYKAARERWLESVRGTSKLGDYVRSKKAALVQRTPVWANREIMDALKATAKYMSETTGVHYVVDHVIPLRGALVSGLHVPLNLRICTFDENRRKGSTFRVIV